MRTARIQYPYGFNRHAPEPYPVDQPAASHQFETYGSGEAYREKHRVILEPVMPSMASGQDEIDKAMLQNSYDAHLQQLGLLNPRYNVDRKTKQVQVGHDGDLEVHGYSVSSFGWMLLRQLDIIVPEEER